MDFMIQYWPYIVVALAIAIILGLLAFRPRQRVRLTDSAPLRPHMVNVPREGRGLAGEAAAATSDVAGELFGAPVRRELDGQKSAADDLLLLKGVGPKFGEALLALGFNRFEQLAGLTPAEIERLDAQVGAFRGRIVRDRIVEQAEYLARGDIDGYEQRFGKL
jgi:predicted flap endonuclease-1-like 5' DNA nuclease